MTSQPENAVSTRTPDSEIGQDALVRDPAGQDQDLLGQDEPGQGSFGQDAPGQDGPGLGLLGQDLPGQDPAAPPVAGRHAVERIAPLREGSGTAAAAAAPDSSDLVEAGGGVPASALAAQQWPGILALFVDDPRGAVERAAAAAQEQAAALAASLEREQAALSASWQDDASTEDLRTALQQYRSFCNRIASTVP